MQARIYCYLEYFNDVLGLEFGDQRGVYKWEKPILSRKVVREIQDKETNGQLVCPPPQCLTDNKQLLLPLASPWYHATTAGYCGYQACDGPEKASLPKWCQKDANNCVSCKGLWCPPKGIPYWSPVDAGNFEAPPSSKDPPPVEKFVAENFPVNICNRDPLTQISKADANGLPWIDPAGDQMKRLQGKGPIKLSNDGLKDLIDQRNNLTRVQRN